MSANPITAKWLDEHPNVRAGIYAAAFVAWAAAGAWQVAEGDLVKAVGFFAGAIVAELARRNVRP